MPKIIPCLALVLLSGCATIVSGTSQTVSISTTPGGATCAVERMGAPIGTAVTTPGVVTVNKNGGPLTVRCSKPGYQTATAAAESSFNGWTFGNIILGGLIGVVVDASTGANFDYPRTMAMELQRDLARPMSAPAVQEPAPALMSSSLSGRRSIDAASGWLQAQAVLDRGDRTSRDLYRVLCKTGDQSACIMVTALQRP